MHLHPHGDDNAGVRNRRTDLRIIARDTRDSCLPLLKLQEAAEVQVSMSIIGCCCDNVMQEYFRGTLETECADRPFPS